MDWMITQLKDFVENGGVLRLGENPKYNEPFYGEYMKQYLLANYKAGDKIRLHEESNEKSVIYEGVILSIGYRLSLLISGRKVYKDKRNKKDFNYRFIKSVELLIKNDGTFDLSIVDPEEWSWMNDSNGNNEEFFSKKTEGRKATRAEDGKKFHRVFPEVDFEKVHVIKICGGCHLYWPFAYNDISAEVFMVRDEGVVTPVSCKTGTPFPNKNSITTYNCKYKESYPDLYLYLSDEGFVYRDVNVICIWTINTYVSGKETVIKVVNVHRVGDIKPIEDEHNMIFVDMRVSPLLEYGNSLFSISKHACLLETMMNRDIYAVLNTKEDVVSIVKESEEEESCKYVDMSKMALLSFEFGNEKDFRTFAKDNIFPFVEIFCTMDKEPECYYSSSWRNCRKKYSFKMLEEKIL